MPIMEQTDLNYSMLLKSVSLQNN
uniref:Uncharacterized protein n=1 Tax=Anguilla anguilla TaxID=7936 RepID=A0A0E9VL77_ANGAN